MNGSLGEVLAELRELISVIDEAVAQAERAQTGAQEAQSAYHEAGTGSQRPDIRKAEVDVRTAGEKAGKTARLLAEAATAFATYVNIIAPGTVPARQSAPEAMPSGQQLMDEAPSRNRRIDLFIKKASSEADDLQDGAKDLAKSAVDGARAAAEAIRGDHGPHGTMTTTPERPVFQQAPRTAVPENELVAAALVSVLAGAAAARAITSYASKRGKKEHSDEHEK